MDEKDLKLNTLISNTVISISRLETIITALDPIIYGDIDTRPVDIENMFDILKQQFEELKSDFKAIDEYFNI